MNQTINHNNNHQEQPKGITKIAVSGYKSLYEECTIEVRPLTILAGANSSGKSSIMQPLLLMKQTLEATYDPGALLLNGPNVKFTSAAQILSRSINNTSNESFTVKIHLSEQTFFRDVFKRQANKGIILNEMEYTIGNEKITLKKGMKHEDIVAVLPKELKEIFSIISNKITDDMVWSVIRDRCFLGLRLNRNKQKDIMSTMSFGFNNPGDFFQKYIRKIIHVPGLRGNPERIYKTTAIGQEFPGTFENYVASVINYWQQINNSPIEELSNSLATLGLTCKVSAKQIDDTQVELLVGRLNNHSDGRENDLVSIADVGFGVSQTLPVLVALLVAKPGQLVYIEQPEIHLHPRAQVAMAEILASAAKKGVKVVIETHSDRLLLAIQSLVAEGNLSPDLVKLHWFTRQEDGITRINSADLDETGAFGDWPEDFGDVSLQLENRYLSAAEARLMQGTNGS